MKKKIIAGVAALILASAAVPVSNEIYTSLPVDFGITASAVTSEVTEGNLHATIDQENMYISVQALPGFFDSAASKITINTSSIKTAVEKSIAGDEERISDSLLKGYKVSFDAGAVRFTDFVNLSNVEFTDDFITRVGDGLFAGCGNLQTVTLSSSITEIGNSSFSGLGVFVGSGKNTMDLKNVTVIGNNAFSGCPLLEYVNFNSNTKTIGDSAFSGNGSIKKIELPGTVESIGNGAFSACTQMESFSFGNNNVIESLGSNIFSGCTTLSKITANGKENTFPESADLIGSGMLSGCTNLQSFIWPARWTLVPASTFAGDTKLNKVIFGKEDGSNSRVEVVAESAFSGCTGLVSLVLPQSCENICTAAFSNCTRLEKLVVSDNLQSIDGTLTIDENNVYTITHPLTGENAPDPKMRVSGATFSNCTLLTLYPRKSMDDASKNPTKYANKVILPEGVTAIPTSCFFNCTGITSIEMDNVETIGDAAFQSCTSLKSAKISDAVTVINASVFNTCTSLKDVTVSKKLTTILASAFAGCEKLETLTPSDKKKLDFTIQFPDSCGGAQNSAFLNCSSFKYINFGENSNFGVVGESSFNGCSSLLGSNINGNANNTISLPSGVKVIQRTAFANCTSLDNITFLGEITAIDQAAFTNCTALEYVTMNNTIKELGASAFSNCTSLKQMPQTTDKKPALTNLDAIYQSAFENCSSLESAFISKNISRIYPNAFAGCTSMKNVQLEKDSKLSVISESAFLNCESLELFSTATKGTKTEFPTSLTSIEPSAFANCGLVDVTLKKPAEADTENFVKASAFANNKKLVTVDFSEANMTEIADSTFAGCENLKTVYLPANTVTTFGRNAFGECHFLHTLGAKGAGEGKYVIPESITAIEAGVFVNNYSMQKLQISEKTTSLDMSMFNISITQEQIEENGYTPIDEIIVDANNPEYSSDKGVLFNKDKSVLLCYPIHKPDTDYTIPDSVENIDTWAAAGNNFLLHLTLNGNLKTIGASAFQGVDNLEYVLFGKNSTVDIGGSAFTAKRGLIALYAPAGSTAENYAVINTYSVKFVDNDKSAATLTFLDAEGNPIEGEFKFYTQSYGIYGFGISQLTKAGEEAQDYLKWSSSNPEIAAVDENGVVSVQPGKFGKVTITVVNANNTVSSSFVINVVDEAAPAPVDPVDPIEPVDPNFKLGDLNGDNLINVTDAALAAAHVKGLRALPEEKLKAADINADEKVNVADCALIAAHVKGLRSIN